MSTYLSNRNSSGKTDENGHFRFPLKLVDGYILEGLEVKAKSTPTMHLDITAGEVKIPYSDYSYAAWSDATTDITISTASSANPRIDRVVAYIDRTMSFTSSQINNPGALKFKVVAGTAAASPSAPNDSTVQTSVGSGNPWVELAKVNVPKSASSITTAYIDNSGRTPVTLSPSVKVSDVATVGGTPIKFAVINEGDTLPSAIPDTTLIVLVAKS